VWNAGLIGLLLVLLALTFWRPLRRIRGTLDLSHLASTGHAFLLVGYLFGTLVPEESLLAITGDIGPIVAFVGAWVGFAIGMRFDLRVLRTIPTHAFVVAFTPAFGAAVATGVATYGVLALAPDFDPSRAIGAALVIGGAAASSGPTLPAVIRSRLPGRRPRARAMLRMIEFSAGIDDVLTIVLAVLAFALFRVRVEAFGPESLLLAAVLGGFLLGFVAWLFLGGQAADDERLLFGLAMLAFIGGYAAWLQLAPASVAALSAMMLVNLPGDRGSLLISAVRRVERPALVILMVVIGMHAAGPLLWTAAPLFVLMTAVRFLAKHWAGQLVAGPVAGPMALSAPRGWALGLISQGNLGLLIALSLYQIQRDDPARTLLAAVAAASIANELIAPSALLQPLRAESAESPVDEVK